MTFSVGSLVKARGREWVVLPESSDELLMLRPLGGSEDEVTGIVVSLEDVTSATFKKPDASKVGDYHSCRLLRDAVRFGFRSSAGPFRSFGKIAVEPRPYQLVPLLMALKLDPVRILIADDVGIGKTIEACLIARELLERGDAKGLAVLCPPQLAEQWQQELKEKFHIDAELVLPSTANRLEKDCDVGQSLFDVYRHTVVSLDFIKLDKRRAEFQRSCPDLVIVDEAHTCAYAYEGRGSRHQRHQLLKGLAERNDRNIILVTATPHSGKEAAFRSLIGILDPKFTDYPEDLTGRENERNRRELARYFIQRRRPDILHFLDSDTVFPERDESEITYQLSSEYKELFKRVLRYASERVRDPQLNKLRQRVRWWSALALLRCLASSPAAAAATLRNRAAANEAETEETADEIGRQTVLDVTYEDSAEAMDIVPGSETEEESDDIAAGERRRLLEMARLAEELKGDKDEKLVKALKVVKQLLDDGFQPIVFCRFIETAEYLGEQFRERLPQKIEIAVVTGNLPPADRAERVLQLGEYPKRVLIATDCLSEGVNLQQYFDAVFHYDLSWNPTRHEQREGRVDRYGQPSKKVRVVTYYGTDNQIDGIVLDVLIRKHKAIRNNIGISVSVPVDTNDVIEAIFEGLLLREQQGKAMYEQMTMFEEYFKPSKENLHKTMDIAAEREKRSRSMFAQESISRNVEEIKAILQEITSAIGSNIDVERFFNTSIRLNGGTVKTNGSVEANLTGTPRELKDALGLDGNQAEILRASFRLPVKPTETYLSRTHPIVEGLSNYILDTALDPILESVAARSGVIRSKRVQTRTTLVLLRLRFHIVTDRLNQTETLLAEDTLVAAFEGSPEHARWLANDIAEALVEAQSDANVSSDVARNTLNMILSGIDVLAPKLEEFAVERGQALLEAHRKVRSVSQIKNVAYSIEPKLPVDIIGIYIYLPLA